MKSLALSLDAFAANRREAQGHIEDALRPLVRRALDGGTNTRGWDELLDEVSHQWRLVYQEERGRGGGGMPRATRQELRNALTKTNRSEATNATVDRIAVWLATAVLAHATMSASDDDEEELFMEWVTMEDSSVRSAHAHTAGQQRPIGERFTVGEHKMPYPGWPGVPIELWINCRCTLRPVLASEVNAMTASSRTVTQEEAMTAATDEPEVSETDVEEDQPITKDEAGDLDSEGDATDAAPIEDIAVPWHGVLAPEGKKSGDGRGFKEGSLSHRPLPLPLTWQKTSAEGHMQSVVVAKIEQVAMVDGEMRATGHYLTIPEADEALGLVADFGRFGVSVDADDADFDMDEMTEDDPTIWFSRARVCGASQVPIPAFHEAWIALGDAPDGFLDGGTPLEEEEPEEEALVASGFWRQFVDVAPGVTEDGPGWLTHPVDTDRLRDYWTHGEGAAKIAWGSPGDFDRCRANLAEYVMPQYLNGYCANRHKDALGVWPGQEASVRDALEDTEMSESISLVASAALSAVPDKAPAEWFADPEFEPGDGRLVRYKNGGYGCPMTITEEGQVFGHIATWKECHSKWGDNKCILAPHSARGYADFLLGQVLTTEGPVPCGSLTIGAGHAEGRLKASQAMEHYDNACAVFADVTVGEDEYGIWFAGWVRPGTTVEMLHAARASKLSGDWRKIGGQLEMIAALAVNVPGFRVPRVAASVQQGEMVSLVAAGSLAPEEPVALPEGFDVSAFALAVVEEIEARHRRDLTWAAFTAKVEQMGPVLEQVTQQRREKVDALRARIEGGV